MSKDKKKISELGFNILYQNLLQLEKNGWWVDDFIKLSSDEALSQRLLNSLRQNGREPQKTELDNYLEEFFPDCHFGPYDWAKHFPAYEISFPQERYRDDLSQLPRDHFVICVPDKIAGQKPTTLSFAKMIDKSGNGFMPLENYQSSHETYRYEYGDLLDDSSTVGWLVVPLSYPENISGKRFNQQADYWRQRKYFLLNSFEGLLVHEFVDLKRKKTSPGVFYIGNEIAPGNPNVFAYQLSEEGNLFLRFRSKFERVNNTKILTSYKQTTAAI